MILSTILTMTASVMDWLLTNFPEVGILIFVVLCIWKFISWLDGKFSAIDAKFSAMDTKFLEFRSEVTLEFVKVKAEMASEFAKVRAEIADVRSEIAEVRSDVKLINHRLDDHDRKMTT